MRRTLLRQPANRPVEINLLQDVLAGELPARLQWGYADALAKADEILTNRGWIEVPITAQSPLEEAARIWRATAPGRRTDPRAARAADDFIQELRSAGPQSGLVDERLDELQFAFYEAGPSQYGRLAIDYLLLCQDATKHALPSLASGEDIKQACAELEVAAQCASRK
jgi:hypothetical protein